MKRNNALQPLGFHDTFGWLVCWLVLARGAAWAGAFFLLITSHIPPKGFCVRMLPIVPFCGFCRFCCRGGKEEGRGGEGGGERGGRELEAGREKEGEEERSTGMAFIGLMWNVI